MKNIKEYSKITTLLTSSQRKELNIFIFLFVIGMFLETLGIGLVIPILTLLSESSFNLQNYAIFNKLDFGELTKIQIVIGSMLILLFVYSFKTIFLTYVSFRQVKYLTKINIFHPLPISYNCTTH